MCLYIREKFGPLEKPIKVWKVGYHNHLINCLITPFRKTHIPFNYNYKDPLYVEYNNSYITSASVDKGYIHAYTDKSEAVYMAQHLNCDVFEAILPKGSVGFYGIDGDICSNQILIMNNEFKQLYEELCVQ